MSKWTDLCIQLHFPLIFVSEPTYTEKILKEAFEYYKLNKSIIKLKNDNEHAYFIPAGETTELNKEDCRNYVTKMELCICKRIPILRFLTNILVNAKGILKGSL
jgi:hypothetical protein